MTELRGAGGGGSGSGKSGGGGVTGGGGFTPSEAADSLQSVQFASVLDVISEGEIEGIEGGLEGIYLEGTPVQNPSGRNNFKGYTVVTRNGTQAQSLIPGLNGSEREKLVNTEFTKGFSATRQITDEDVDRVRITVQLPALQQFQDNGDITGTSVQLRVDVQYNGAGYTTAFTDTISGKSSNVYKRDYILPLTGAFPVDIRLVRITADPSSARTMSDTYWYSYTEIIDERLRYPNTALAFLRFDSRQFSGVPSRKYLVRGIKVKIPSNATVDTTTHLGRLTYSGVWDGTFQAATWTNDPAWCLYDLLINNRYGASIPESSLDRYDFYSISQYCNELVDNGRGGQEPRFSCNLLLNSRDEVYNVIQEMTSLFRGIAYYGAGSLVLQQDKPSDAQYLLGPSNVVDGLFTYSGTSQKARHTTATVAYQEYDTQGEVAYEYVEDQDAIIKYGVINKDIKALGCYSQGQAHRAGKWALLSEQNLTETVTFSVAIDSGIVLRPGMVVDIADPLRAGSRRSGRVSSATNTTITVDSNTDLSVDLSKSPTISVMMPSGLVETLPINAIDVTEIQVLGTFNEVPNANAIWLIQTKDIQSQQFRVLNVAEASDGVYGVTALAYNETIYDAIESDLKLEQRDISNLSTAPDIPTDITVREYIYQDGQNVFVGAEVTWQHNGLRTNEYRVQYRVDDDNIQTLTTTAKSVTLKQVRAGTLNVQINAYSYLNKPSETAEVNVELVGKSAVPVDVSNLSIEPVTANSARLRWTQSAELDVKVSGSVLIRHSSLTDGTATWNDSVELVTAVAGSASEAIIPLLEGEVLVKFQDDGGRVSVNATSVLVDLPDTLGELVVLQHRENTLVPPFPGTKVNTFYSSEFTALSLSGQDFDLIPDLDLVVNLDYLGQIANEGEYEFNEVLDLGATYAFDLARHMVTRGIFPNDLVDSRLDLVDDLADWDGLAIDSVNAQIFVRTTTDDPAGTPTWSNYFEFANGTFNGRGFQFKAILYSGDPDQTILIDELGYNGTFQRRQEQSATAIASGTSTKSIAFERAFFTGTAALGGVNSNLPSIGITVQNLGDGERVNISNVTGTGFDVDVLDSGGSNVDRQFSWSAVGYGRGV